MIFWKYNYIILAALTTAAPTVDLTQQSQVKSALSSMAAVLMNYHKQGKIVPDDSKGPEGFQWFEGGLFYGIMMDYIKITQDNRYSTAVVNELTKESFGRVGSFLGNSPAASELGGKWNDDILWYSIPAMTGAELFGKDTLMPGGVTYLKLADNTYQEVMRQWDNKCGGGLYWIRSSTRTGKNQWGQSYAYKSTITQNQAILHAALLGSMTGNSSYYDEGERIYRWMLSSGIISRNFDIYDGIDADGCSIANLVLSYKNGMASGALAALAYHSKRTAMLNAAHSIFRNGLTTFTRNNIVYDPCELPELRSKCPENVATPKGTLVRGWGLLYEYTNDQAIRNQIKQILQTTVSSMLRTCDDNWNCGQDWLGGTRQTGSNVHFQMNAVELMNAYYKTFFNGPIGRTLAAPTTGAAGYKPPPPFGSAYSTNAITVPLFVLCSFFILFM